MGSIKVKISRTEFNTTVRSLLFRMTTYIDKALEDAKWTNEDVDSSVDTRSRMTQSTWGQAISFISLVYLIIIIYIIDNIMLNITYNSVT